ncbi:2TM domain-containing protein [Flavobacterium sp.]
MKPSETQTPEEYALEMARYRVNKMKRFYTHLFIYIIGIAIYVAKTYFGAPFNFWPIQHINCFVMMVWTFFLIVQGLNLFVRENVFTAKWEQRKIQQYMNEQNNKYE